MLFSSPEKLCALSHAMSENDKRGMPDQIPSRQNEDETGARISEQNGVQGERKEVDVKDYSKGAARADTQRFGVSCGQAKNNQVCAASNIPASGGSAGPAGHSRKRIL